jgi:hypothetical protein
MTMILLKSVKLLIKIAFSVLAVTVFTATSASSQTTGPLPSADDVVSRMVRSDIERRSELTGYTALRHEAVHDHLRGGLERDSQACVLQNASRRE